jgi:hypothetical protein
MKVVRCHPQSKQTCLATGLLSLLTAKFWMNSPEYAVSACLEHFATVRHQTDGVLPYYSVKKWAFRMAMCVVTDEDQKWSKRKYYPF